MGRHKDKWQQQQSLFTDFPELLELFFLKKNCGTIEHSNDQRLLHPSDIWNSIPIVWYMSEKLNIVFVLLALKKKSKPRPFKSQALTATSTEDCTHSIHSLAFASSLCCLLLSSSFF